MEALDYGVITRQTNLYRLMGVRVRIDTTVRGTRFTRYGVLSMLRHSECELTGMGPHVIGYFREESHGTCRGGNTAICLDYDDSVVSVRSAA